MFIDAMSFCFNYYSPEHSLGGPGTVPTENPDNVSFVDTVKKPDEKENVPTVKDETAGPPKSQTQTDSKLPVFCQIENVETSELCSLDGRPLGNFLVDPDLPKSAAKAAENVSLLFYDNKYRLLSPPGGIVKKMPRITKGKITARVYNISGCLSKELLAAIHCCSNPKAHYLKQSEGYAIILRETGLLQKDLIYWFNLSQSTISNRLRLLSLSETLRKETLSCHLTERHCRALLNIDTDEMKHYVLKLIVSGEISSRRIELLAKHLANKSVAELGRDGYISLIKDILYSPPDDLVRERRAFFASLNKLIANYRRSGAAIQAKTQEKEDFLDIFLRIYKKSFPPT